MLELDRVSKVYKVGTFGGSELPAVRQVSFAIEPGEVVSLIGESGSGKSTIGRMILRLIRDHGRLDPARRHRRRATSTTKRYYGDVQGVFQDPFSSYNPIFKVDRVFGMIRSGYFSGLAGAGVGREGARPRSRRSASTRATCSASTRTSSRAASSSAC